MPSRTLTTRSIRRTAMASVLAGLAFASTAHAGTTGNVSVTQGPTLLKSGTMTVFYAKDGGSAATGSSNIERLEVDGKVYVKSDRQVATGDKGTFDMKTEVLVLSGNEVVLSEGSNVLRGCKLTVQMKSGQAQVDGCTKAGGRVQMKLDPSSRQ